jgi:hypothetical protein
LSSLAFQEESVNDVTTNQPACIILGQATQKKPQAIRMQEIGFAPKIFVHRAQI